MFCFYQDDSFRDSDSEDEGLLHPRAESKLLSNYKVFLSAMISHIDLPLLPLALSTGSHRSRNDCVPGRYSGFSNRCGGQGTSVAARPRLQPRVRERVFSSP